MLFFAVALAFLPALVAASPSRVVPRQECAQSYSICAPAGATGTVVPDLGSGLAPLYPNLLASVKGLQVRVRRDEDLREREVAGPALVERESPNICCIDGTACLTLQFYEVPFCYDRFTTNFFLPNSAIGTLDSGAYTAPDGTANLISGNFNLSAGGSGNIYPSSSPLNTATLVIPTPFTSSGVGSAIPASALGGEATFTVTIPGTTIPPTTIVATTIPPTTVSVPGVVITQPGTTLPGETITVGNSVSTELGVTLQLTTITLAGGISTELGTTIVGTTLPGTTLPGETTTVTSTEPTSSSKGGVDGRALPTGMVAMGVMVGGLMGAVVGL